MIDSNGRLFGKVSVVDIIIVLAFLIAIAGFAYKITSGDETVTIKSDTPITFTIKIDNVRQFSVDAVSKGDVIYEQFGQRLGVVSEVKTKPQHKLVDMQDGSQVYGEVEGRMSLLITINAEGRVNDTGYLVNGNRLVSAGSLIKIQSDKINCEGYVTQVS